MVKKNQNNIIIYQSEDGQTKIEVKLKNETVWLSQKQMADLFDCTIENIIFHLQNVFITGELSEKATTKDYLVVQKEGNREVNRFVKIYNLDAIISIGYRINSIRGTQFRIWATKQLREFIVKGFVLNDERLENGGYEHTYFQELLERVRKIRASEINLYQKVKDIFATSADYSTRSNYTQQFYATMQNKFHYAIVGKTAAEIVISRINGKKENMGMTNFQGKSINYNEAQIAKNYMMETELRQLYLLVEQFLSYSELQIERKRVMYMKDWLGYLDEMLKANKLEVLLNKGKVSHKKMKEIVKNELKKFNIKKLTNKKTKV